MQQKQKNKSEELATKKDLKHLEDSLRGNVASLEIKIDLKLDKLKRDIDDKAQGYRDEVLTSNDKLAKTLETIREDLEIGNFQTGEKIRDHEGRIKHLEKISQTA